MLTLTLAKRLTDVVYQSMSEGELEVCILACKALINLIQLQDESVEIDKEFLDEAQDERLGVVMLQLLDIVRPKMKVPPPLVRMKSSENLFSTTPLGDEEIAVSDTGEEMEEMEENNFKINTQIKRNPGPEVWKKECVQVATRLLEVLGYGADDREVAEVGV
ncbi:hypothetical protein BC830DRAFT_869480 [Chytriomyces sp. MP71]|nr:hypothetical protein BC830DRAFT_869480 [Chytriomyces sp. MP71]